MRVALALVLCLWAAPSPACDLLPDPNGKPLTWEESILAEPVVFLGEVVAIKGEGGPDPKALFKVEMPIVGDRGPTFETMQGNGGGDCGVTFEVGSTVLFAGDW